MSIQDLLMTTWFYGVLATTSFGLAILESVSHKLTVFVEP